MKEYKDLIINYYKNLNSDKKQITESFPSRNNNQYAITFNNGIGDTVIINNLLFETEIKRSNIHIYSNSQKFFDITKYNIFIQSNFFKNDALVYRIEVLEDYNLGSGHLIQKMRRFFQLPILNKPKSFLNTGLNKKKNKIGIHLTVGPSASELNQINSYARQIYKHNIEIIQKFINDNPNYEFIEFGGSSVGLKNCKNFCGQSLSLSIEELSTCEYFIGLNSGFMNLAACFNIKSIIIVNIPVNSFDIVLPVLKDVRVPDMNWLYPQNVHLHQDNETEMVPLFNYKNLEKAINGEIYPFWSDNHLDLIYG
jgi:hypothetical protein